MTHSTKQLVLTLIAVTMMIMPCLAQEVEPPFTWEGKGAASFISQGGIEEFDFQFELSVDEQGMVKGQTSSENGAAGIKHLFYTEPKQYDFPGFFTRKIIIVFILNEDGDTPMLSILNGRILVDKFLYGEVLMTGYETGSETAKALGVEDLEATLMEGEELPNKLKSVLKKCFPIGVAKIEGDYKKEATGTVAGSEPIVLFNKEDLKDGYVYLKDSDADLEGVWRVLDGELRCSGKLVGFLRTRQEYSDYKLVFEWRWLQKPGNSGVLLRMGDQEKIWPLCMEAQLMHNRAGDLIGMGCDFNENKAPKGGPISYTPRMNDSNEKEPGGWNKYEIVCKGDTIEVTINGQLQNKATGVGIRKGYIGFQSEGVPIVFRNIKLTPLR
jgi:hypothetical protein